MQERSECRWIHCESVLLQWGYEGVTQQWSGEVLV